MTYQDPSQFDPRFPDRPTHPDFVRLANAAQNVDSQAGSGRGVSDILNLDEDSVVYFIEQRLGAMGITSTVAKAMYLDAITIATYAERGRQVLL